MKRTLILVLVVGLLIGLGYIGFSAQSSAAPPTQPPQTPGASVAINNPLDDQGNVRVSLPQPVEVTATAPLPVSLEEGPGPVLITLAENVTIEPGERFKSEWLDVKTFRLFKLYARLTPYVSETPAAVFFGLNEHPVGAAGPSGLGHYGYVPADYEWQPHGGTIPRWTLVSSFGGLYSEMRAYARNDGDTPATIYLYLLMAEE